jgi:hypothetical protein
MKEVFIDHSIDGEPLPDNIFWVAAMNPLIDKETEKSKRDKDEDEMLKKINKANFTGVAMDTQVFSVRAIPQSMEEVILFDCYGRVNGISWCSISK